jgi:hypothetical protein
MRQHLIFEGQYGLRPGCSCGIQVFTVCQNIADSLDNGGRIYDIDFSKAFCLVLHDRLLRKVVPAGKDPKVVAWIREVLL